MSSSVNYEKVLGAVNVRYVYGLTATPVHQNGQHPITFMQYGAIRHAVDAKAQAKKAFGNHSGMAENPIEERNQPYGNYKTG
jgi:superfamily II DNA or RNA helicase